MSLTPSPTSRPAARRPDGGFTLIEMIVAMAVSTLILIAALTAFDSSRRISRRNFSLTDAQQSGTYALQETALNIRRAGFGTAASFAIVRNAGNTPDPAGTVNSPLATWNNYTAAMVTIADNGVVGTAPKYMPVLGTDGITIRYADLSQPPLHICYAPDNTHLDLARNDGYMNANYPNGGAGSNPVFDLVTNNINCYGAIANAATDAGRLTMTGPGANIICCQGCIASVPPPASVNSTDPACKNALKGTNNCVRVPVTLPANCDMTKAVTNTPSSQLYPSRTASFWISTEDLSGDLSLSPPVLVSRVSGGSQSAAQNSIKTATTRVLANGIEDLQLVFYRANTATNVLVVHDSGAPVSANTPIALPTNAEMLDIRAIRVDLIARTGVTDLMYKNQAYCSTKPGLVPLFTRPALNDHAAPAAGTTSYCDGFRRLGFTQLINMPNMTAKPNG